MDKLGTAREMPVCALHKGGLSIFRLEKAVQTVQKEDGKEMTHWAKERDKYNDMQKKLIKIANDHKDNRDELNQEVQKLKDERDKYNAKVNELSAKVSKQRKKSPGKGHKSLQKLKDELRALELRHMTETLSASSERYLIAEMKALRQQIEERKKNAKLSALIEELNENRKKAEELHEEMGRIASNAQEQHELMTEAFEKSHEYRRQADEMHKKYIEYKTKVEGD